MYLRRFIHVYIRKWTVHTRIQYVIMRIQTVDIRIQTDEDPSPGLRKGPQTLPSPAKAGGGGRGRTCHMPGQASGGEAPAAGGVRLPFPAGL